MTKGTKAVLLAVGAVVAAVVVGVLVVKAAPSNPDQVRLGDDEFNAGYAEVLADAIVEGDGQPLIFNDVSGGDRDIYVQHLGEDDTTGWTAFETRLPGSDDCFAVWDVDRELFVSSCDETVTFLADGTGLVAYPTRVNADGRVIVDLRRPVDRTATTTVATSTSGGE